MVKYTREQRLRAVRLYEQYDRSAASLINELGYPSRMMLARWGDESEPGWRRLRRAPVDEATRSRAVARYACLCSMFLRQVGWCINLRLRCRCS